MDAQALPEYTDVRNIIKQVETDAPEFLTRLEASVVADGEINVSPVKGSPIQKMVSHKLITHGRRAILGGLGSTTFRCFHFSLFVAGQQLVEKINLQPGSFSAVVF